MNKPLTIRQEQIISPMMGIFLIVAVMCAWFVAASYLEFIILICVFGIFLLGFKKPIWALSALFISQLTIQGYMVPLPMMNMSLRLLLLLVTLLIMASALINKTVSLGPGFKRIAIPFFLYALMVIISNMVNGSGFDWTFEEFRNLLVPFLILVLMPIIITDTRKMKILLVVSFIVIICSSIVGILQHYAYNELRVLGLTESTLDLSYITSISLMFMAALFIVKNSTSVKKPYLVLFSLVMAAALYFTYTRSSLIAVAIGLVALLFLFLKRFNWKLILTISFILIITLEVTGFSQSTTLGARSEREQDESSMARPILYQAGIAIAKDNLLFGIGGYQWFELSPQYESAVDPKLIQYEEDRYWEYRTLGSVAPHNDFVKTWAYYGSIAVLAYIWLYYAIIRNLSDAYKRSRKRFTLAVTLGLAAGLVTYVINSFYHNLLISLPLFWMVAGFSIVVTKLSAEEKIIRSARKNVVSVAKETS